MRLLVLDTNVLVSALLVPGSPPSRVLQGFRDGDWSLAVSGTILDEYARVLARERLGLPRRLVTGILEEIEGKAFKVIPSRRFAAVPEDPSDEEFLDVAVEARVEAVVSGDRHLLALEGFRGIPILTPVRFLER